MKNNEMQKLLNKIFTCSIVIIVILVLNTILIISSGSPFRTLSTKQDNSNNGGNNTEETNGEYDVSAFTEINASELKNKTKGENTVVYIGRSTCSWCVKFVPILTEATEKKDLNTLYIDIAKIIDFSAGGVKDQTGYDILTKMETVSGFENYMTENFGATPMLLIVKDGKLIDSQTGYVESDALNTFLEKNGF